MKMVTTYNTKDMISFGKYLLSEERKKVYKNHPNSDSLPPVEDRLKEVSQADIENWKSKGFESKLTLSGLHRFGFTKIPEYDKSSNNFFYGCKEYYVTQGVSGYRLQASIADDGLWIKLDRGGTTLFAGTLETKKEFETILKAIKFKRL